MTVVLRGLAILLIVLVAGPEFGLAIESLAVLNVLGAELFFVSLLLGVRSLPLAAALVPLRGWVERWDPYFFIPSWTQVRACPALCCHAIPGLVTAYLSLLVFSLF